MDKAKEGILERKLENSKSITDRVLSTNTEVLELLEEGEVKDTLLSKLTKIFDISSYSYSPISGVVNGDNEEEPFVVEFTGMHIESKLEYTVSITGNKEEWNDGEFSYSVTTDVLIGGKG